MNQSTRLLAFATFLVAAIVLAVWLTTQYLAIHQPNRGVAMDDVAALYPEKTKPLGQIVVKTYREYRGNTIKWSAAYFGCLFGSAFFSALAGLLLKLELLASQPKVRNDLAAAFATLAALLVTLSTTGDFQHKWQANRAAAAAMENLAYELLRPSASAKLDDILTRIQAVNDARNRDIIGEVAASPRTDDSPSPHPPPGGGQYQEATGTDGER